MKRITVSKSNFEEIIKNDYIYVDKTKFLYEIISKETYYFLSRPRRFGKSLAVSTLEAIFEGKKELFKGLHIADKEWEWEEYPIIKLDFNVIENTSLSVLKKEINDKFEEIALKYGVELTKDIISSKFEELIQKLSQKYEKGVVILVDEYDKPIISHLGKDNDDEQESKKKRLKIAKKNQEFLKIMYDNLKPLEKYIKTVFITGVSKFTKVSIFSTLNNLIELDQHPKFADFLGYREDELRKYFNEHFKVVAKKYNQSLEEIYDQFRYMYNGFRFTTRDMKVYNPFSIGRALSYQEIDYYWFDSGTPTFLIDLIKEEGYDVTEFEDIEVGRNTIKVYNIEKLNIIPLLFQTGYLTIKDSKGYGRILKLSYPNKEVEDGFCNQLLQEEVDKLEVMPLVYNMKQAFIEEDYEDFFELIDSVFASIPYSIIPSDKEDESQRGVRSKDKLTKRELYYHTIFYLVITLMSDNNFRIYSEILSNKGRIDMVIDTSDRIYIVEFKCNQSVEKALEQIRDKNYAQRYLKEGKEIILVGIDFDSNDKILRDWKIVVSSN